MASIFTKIIHGEIPAHKVAEDDRFLAFLDINPLAKGHTLIIPKKEVDYIFDLDNDTLAGMMLFAKKVAQALDQVMPAKRVGIEVLGLEVPHAHIHLIPFNSERELCFSNPKLKLDQKEFKEIAEKISNAVNL